NLVFSESIPLLIHKLSSVSNVFIETLLISTIGNIARESELFRDVLLSFHVLPMMKERSLYSNDPQIVRNATYTLAMLCKGKPRISPIFIEECMEVFFHHLRNATTSEDTELLIESLWGISYSCDGESRRPSLEKIVQNKIHELLALF